MNQLVKKAKDLAIRSHEGLVYAADNRPYSWHLEKVAGLAERLGYGEDVVATCWLHDILEDTQVSQADLKKEFPKSVVAATESVTFKKDVDLDMIAKAKSNPIGHAVKYCDVAINFSASAIYGPHLDRNQWELTVDRYLNYLKELREGLPTPQEVDNWLIAEHNDSKKEN